MELSGEMNPATRDQHEEKLTRDRFRRRQPAADICAVHRAGHPEPVDAGPEEHRSGEEDQEYLEAQHKKDKRKEDWHQHHQHAPEVTVLPKRGQAKIPAHAVSPAPVSWFTRG